MALRKEPCGGEGSGPLEAKLRAELDRAGEGLLVYPACELEDLLVLDPEPDPVGELEPRFLAQHLDGADQVVESVLEAQLVVEPGVERHGDEAVRRDGPALFADPLDE